MSHYLFILVGAVLVNNVVLVKILGLCPFMGVSKKLETAYGMGAATTFVLTMATGASYIIDHYLLMPFGLEYLRTLSFIVTIAAIVQLTEMVIAKTSPTLQQTLGIYLPLIVVNCIILGRAEMYANKNGVVDSALDAIGMAQRALEMMLEYAPQRVVFGEPLANRQSVQWWIADAYTRIKAATLMTYETAWKLDKGADAVRKRVTSLFNK